MSAADLERAPQGRDLRRRWVLALGCVLALLLGSFLYSAEEAQARGQAKGSGSANGPVGQRSAAPSATNPEPQASDRKTGRSGPTEQKPAHGQPKGAPRHGGPSSDTRGPGGSPSGEPGGETSASPKPAHRGTDPQGRPHRQASSRPPTHAAPAHRGPGTRGETHPSSPAGSDQRPTEPSHKQPAARGPSAQPAHRPSIHPGRGVGHDEAAGPASHRPAEPPGLAGDHDGAVRLPAHDEHREDSRPGEREIVASPGEARPHQGVPRPAERGGAEFVERGAVGPVEATGRPAGGPVSEQVVGRAFGPQPASRPDAQIVGVQPRGPAANTGEAGGRLIETEAWSVQRALTEEVNLLAFDRLSNVLDSLPARMVEMGLVV